MSLNIKNEDAHRLAQKLSRLTGETMTTAVTIAIQERLERVQVHAGKRGNLSKRLLTIGRDCARHLTGPVLTEDHGELLYDEKGLPK